jgi:hypothetical protein
VLGKNYELWHMAIITTTSGEIGEHVLRLLIPSEILESFDLERIIENDTEILFNLVEKSTRLPKELEGKEVALNGYMNATTLQCFPQKGKHCYLNLQRRRWKEPGSEDKRSYHNEYEYTAKGTMATKSFGAFLKRNSLIAIPSRLAQSL